MIFFHIVGHGRGWAFSSVDLIDKFNRQQIDNILSEVKDIQEQESLLRVLRNKIENKSEEDFKSSKVEEINILEEKLTTYYEKKKQLENSYKVKKEAVEFIKIDINNIENDIGNLRHKEEYKIIFDFTLLFEQNIDIEQTLNDRIESYSLSVKESNRKVEILNQKYSIFVNKYNIINIDDIAKIIEELKDKIFQLYAKEIFIFESFYEQYFKQKIDNLEKVKKDISSHLQITKNNPQFKLN